jgi:hypothetical protein
MSKSSVIKRVVQLTPYAREVKDNSKVRDNLRSAAESLTKAAGAVQDGRRKRKGRFRRWLLVAAGAGVAAGIAIRQQRHGSEPDVVTPPGGGIATNSQGKVPAPPEATPA